MESGWIRRRRRRGKVNSKGNLPESAVICRGKVNSKGNLPWPLRGREMENRKVKSKKSNEVNKVKGK